MALCTGLVQIRDQDQSNAGALGTVDMCTCWAGYRCHNVMFPRLGVAGHRRTGRPAWRPSSKATDLLRVGGNLVAMEMGEHDIDHAIANFVEKGDEDSDRALSSTGEAGLHRTLQFWLGTVEVPAGGPIPRLTKAFGGLSASGREARG
jgi:hypothetical protein